MKRKFLTSMILAAALIFSAPQTIRATEDDAAALAALAALAAASQSTATATDTTNSTTESTYTQTPANDTGYIALGNTYVTPTVSAGQTITLTLPIVNYNFCPITNVVVTPVVSNKVTEWPFAAADLNYTQTIPSMSAYSYGADVNATRAELYFTFKVRDDVLTGFYPISFDVTFLANGEASGQSKTTLTAYVYAQGKAGSGRLEDSQEVSKPRLIVTGFETNPANVHAGETFTLTVHVKNTSSDTAVSNVLFDLQANEETTTSGTSGTTSMTYASFLPTSGSSSLYESSISAGASVDLQLEMTARADLTQKPYVLVVNMTYDAAGKVDYTDKASVSIPVWQESKFDTGEESVMSNYITVGEETSLSFSVYNTGRTTLNNVWFRFKDDAVEGADVFVGTIASGATGYVDANFTGVQENEGTIHGVIEYEDEAGNVTTVEKEFEVAISPALGDDYSDEAWDENAENQQTNAFPQWAIALIVVAAIVAVLVVLVVLKKRRAAKKKKAEEAELFDEDDET